MSEESVKSEIEIVVGENRVRINGSEEFISRELSTVLNQIDMENGVNYDEQKDKQQGESGDIEDNISGDDELSSDISQVANKINVNPSSLAEHFYTDEDGIHIHNPMDIPPKYAVLGYCTIKEELDNITYHNNTETKKKLIDKEKVDIERWGGELLHSLRQGGYIKDDPNTTKSKNKPFKITPSGRKELINWINEDD